eukprot:gene7980-5540_t
MIENLSHSIAQYSMSHPLMVISLGVDMQLLLSQWLRKSLLESTHFLYRSTPMPCFYSQVLLTRGALTEILMLKQH